MFKRSQQDVTDSSKSWYQDKYQHVLTQRNLLALISLISLFSAVVATFAIMRLVPLKSVEPYLLQIDEKSGVTQRVNPLSREKYAANELIDRYFAYQYMRALEGYNASTVYYNFDIVRVMSTPSILRAYRYNIDPGNDAGVAKRLGSSGLRDVVVNSMAYIVAPSEQGKPLSPTSSRNIQARITTTERLPNATEKKQDWVVTITFEYADLSLNTNDQHLNPLGFFVTAYQIQPETMGAK